MHNYDNQNDEIKSQIWHKIEIEIKWQSWHTIKIIKWKVIIMAWNWNYEKKCHNQNNEMKSYNYNKKSKLWDNVNYEEKVKIMRWTVKTMR